MIKKSLLFLMFGLVLLFPLLTGCNNKSNQAVAVLETEYGKIVFEFYPEIAPQHVKQFQELIKQGFYNGIAFHRVEANSLIQGGDPNTIRGPENTWGLGRPDLKTIPAEFSKKNHIRGTVSAARKGNDNNSATTQFFICCRPHPEWDNQYSVFGQVISGMNVVDIISQSPVTEGTTRPQTKVIITRAYLDLRSNYPATPGL